ncbi:MAG TPA: metalloregulator ArsR/SmtB family transcription factor [Chitinophagales bacterium]|nr:metalloregulator ArsR/SmtB family transcription factor [Chitinophagales bacterium]
MPKVAMSEMPTITKNGGSRSAIKIDYAELKRAAGVLRAVNHKLRQQMLQLIEENGRLTVTEIFVRLRLEQSVASQHLAILRHANVVKTERDGKFIYYTLNVPRLDELASIVSELTR